jgi:Ca2+:H+ antiporter
MPGPSDRTPLLSTGNGTAQRPFVHRMVDIFKGPEDDPSWVQSLRFLFFGSWFNVLLVFVPLCIVADKLEWDSAFRFGFSFLAIVPLAKLLGEATEQLAVKLGQTLGGLLNASFGNAVEIIVGVSALLRGEWRTPFAVSLRPKLNTLCR